MNLEQLAQQLIDGQITVAQWESSMREFIRTIHREAAGIAMGGMQNVTQSQWGYVGSLVKKQYAYLDNFAQDIISNPNAWLNGRLLVRMNLYERAAWGTFEQMIRRQMSAMGFDEERRVLGMADHCPGCLEQASRGWQPIGTLDGIGEEECVTNCHCVFEYRKKESGTLFSERDPSKAVDMLFAPREASQTDMLFAPEEKTK